MNVDHLMIHTLWVASVTGTNAKGASTYGTAVAHKARVWMQRGLLENTQGEASNFTHVAQLVDQLQPNDRVWVPGTTPGDLTTARAVMAITSYVSTSGDATLYEVTLG